MNIVYMDGKKEPYTLSSIVAECAGVQHHTITRTIRKQFERFERRGKVGFKIQASESGQQTKDYILNEQQATLLIHILKEYRAGSTVKETLVTAS
ncbi:phage regulatory Rha family protein [Streptococcus pyogenes MGAS2111]|nr:phage regulatory Rha family protein [Streptococcus pyogenes MGAS2111]